MSCRLLIIILIIVQPCISQYDKPLFPEPKKELIKSLGIKARSMYVSAYIKGEWKSYHKKNLYESCLYDTNGNKTEDYIYNFGSGISRRNYFYYESGVLKSVSSGELDGEPTTFTHYYYNQNGNLIKETQLLKGNDSEFITEYSYDSCGVLTAKTSYGDAVIKYEYKYDNAGNLTATIVNNSLEKMHIYSNELTYSMGLVVKAKHYSDDKLGSTFFYKYDNRNNLIEEIIHWEELHKDKKSLYAYDSKGRVVSSVVYEGDEIIFNTRYEYNNNGLMVRKLNYDSKDKPVSSYSYIYETY